MKPKYSFEKSVGAVIFRKKENLLEYLILDYGKNYWGYVKGHVEDQENEEETLRREVEEETGIKNLKIISGFKIKDKYSYRASRREMKKKSDNLSANISKIVIYYLVKVETKNVVKISYEHKGYKWLSYKDALKKITYKNSKNILKKANSFLLTNQDRF